jgi:hypothetical protein
MDCRKDGNLKKCNCTYEPCPRKGSCCDCIIYHKTNGELPACYFSAKDEKTFDRSIEFFVRLNSKW